MPRPVFILAVLIALILATFTYALTDPVLVVTAQLTGEGTRLDEVNKPANLALTFNAYDPALHGVQFTFDATPGGIIFDSEMTSCQEETYQSAIVRDSEKNRITIVFDFEQTSKPTLLICTISITNPPSPTADLTLTLGPVEQTVYLPVFYGYFDTKLDVLPVSPRLNELAYYTFSLSPLLKPSGGVEILFSWSLHFVAQLEVTGTCAGNRDEVHSYQYQAETHTMRIKLQEGYVFQDNDLITCAFTNPVTIPSQLSWAVVSSLDTLIRSDSLLLPSFEPEPVKPVIEAIKVTPNQTKVGVATKLKIEFEISDEYMTDQHDRLFFKTWVKFNAQGKCTYGPDDKFSIDIDNEDDGFSIQIQDDWSSIFYDNIITLNCIGFTPSTEQPATTDNTIKIHTEHYTSPQVEFSLPAFTNDGPEPFDLTITFQTSSNIPQETSTNTWTITSTQDITSAIEIQFNATRASIINPKDCVESVKFDDVSWGVGKFSVAANSIKKNTPFIFTCSVTNQPLQLPSSQVQYEIYDNSKMIWQGPVDVPEYTWPTVDMLAIKMTIEANLKFFSSFQSVTNTFISTLKLKQDDVWPMSITPQAKGDDRMNGYVTGGRRGRRHARANRHRTRPFTVEEQGSNPLSSKQGSNPLSSEQGSNPLSSEQGSNPLSSKPGSYFKQSSDIYANLHTQRHDIRAPVDEIKTYVVVLAFKSGVIEPATIDQQITNLRTALLKSTSAKSINFEPTTSLPYPLHCSDGRLNPVAEGDVDCGVGVLDGHSGIPCRPCALEQHCIASSQCVSQICEWGRCSSNAVHVGIVGVVVMTVIAMIF